MKRFYIENSPLEQQLAKRSCKNEILTNNQDKKYNTKKHLKVNNFYSRRSVLRVKYLWKSWVTIKNIADLSLTF